MALQPEDEKDTSGIIQKMQSIILDRIVLIWRNSTASYRLGLQAQIHAILLACLAHVWLGLNQAIKQATAEEGAGLINLPAGTWIIYLSD